MICLKFPVSQLHSSSSSQNIVLDFLLEILANRATGLCLLHLRDAIWQVDSSCDHIFREGPWFDKSDILVKRFIFDALSDQFLYLGSYKYATVVEIINKRDPTTRSRS